MFLSALVGLMLSASAFAQTSSGIAPSTDYPSPAAAVKSSLDGPMFEVVGRADSDVYMFRIGILRSGHLGWPLVLINQGESTYIHLYG